MCARRAQASGLAQTGMRQRGTHTRSALTRPRSTRASSESQTWTSEQLRSRRVAGPCLQPSLWLGCACSLSCGWAVPAAFLAAGLCLQPFLRLDRACSLSCGWTVPEATFPTGHRHQEASQCIALRRASACPHRIGDNRCVAVSFLSWPALRELVGGKLVQAPRALHRNLPGAVSCKPESEIQSIKQIQYGYC
eukprot:365743-Chlamydomonas_euryale.AAC.6